MNINILGAKSMKNFKRITAVVIAVLTLLSFASCKGNEPDTVTTKPDVTKTPQVDVIVPSVDYETKIRVALTNDSLGLVTSKIKTDKSYACEMLGNCADYDEVAAKLKNSQADIAVLPLNKAVELYKETNGAVRIISASSGISLQVITSDKNIDSVSSLKGKKVYSAVGGTYAEDVVKYVFNKKGVNFDSVIVSDGLTYNEIAQKAIAGEIETCILPEPYASNVRLKNESFSSAVSFNAEYEKASGITSLQGCFVARNEFIEKHPDLVKEFMGFCEIFTNYYNNFTEGAAVELYTNKFFSDAALAHGAITNSHLKYAEGEALIALVKDNASALIDADVSAEEICYIIK